MPPISTDALVLRTYKLGETSKVVVLLTRERGKLRAVAKGARGAAGGLPGLAGAGERGPGLALRAAGDGAVPARGLRAAAQRVPLRRARAGGGAGAGVFRGAARRVRAGGGGGGRGVPPGPGRAGRGRGGRAHGPDRPLPGGVAAEAPPHLSAARPLRRLRRGARPPGAALP